MEYQAILDLFNELAESNDKQAKSTKVEQAVYMTCTRTRAILEVWEQLPPRTPDDAEWQIETIEDLFDERYSEQLQYS